MHPDIQVELVVKNLPASAGDIKDTGLIPGLRRSPGGVYPLSGHAVTENRLYGQRDAERLDGALSAARPGQH